MRRWREPLGFVATALLAACALVACVVHAPPPAASARVGGDSLKYLALGDSYTVGEGVPHDASWPAQLVRALRSQGVTLDAPRIVATTGWTTDELADAVARAHLQDDYDLVSLSIGVNNQYRDRDLDNYRSEFSALLGRAVALAGGRGGRVLVVSIPDWGATRFGRESGRDAAQITREIDAYNAAAREVCAAHGIAFVDITSLSREHGGEPAMLVGDGLHPSSAMYARWVEVVLPAARRLLGG